MGQCFSRLSRKRDSSDEEVVIRSPPDNRIFRTDLKKVMPGVTEGQAREELDADDKNNTTSQAYRQPIDTEDIKYGIFTELKSKEVGEEGKPIILPEDVNSIWALTHNRRFYTNQVWYNPAWDKTDDMDQFVQIMSILIRINFDRWDKFREIFINQGDRRDGDLPFDLGELQEKDFLGRLTGSVFHEAQLAFCPIQIPQQEDEFELDKRRRLPWTDKPELIGAGGFGTVWKRTVAKGFLSYQDTTINSKAKAVAVKTLSGDEACKDEFKNLKELRECLSDHKRIMVNLVTMVEKTSQNNIYHIVYELAAYDLNVFLTHMPQRLRYERHVTPSRERTDSANMWPGDLISESVNLADALDYLHNRLYTKSHTSLKSHVSLSHNDIKPENILVVYPETTNKHDRFPVGQWKFADFGLSVVKVNRSSGIHGKHLSADNAAALNPSQPLQRTHRTERPSSVSQAMPARPPGQYTAPEMDQPTPQLADCRRADVWSFGCVLSEIVTYAVKLDCQLVEEFRNSLGKSEGPSQRSLPDPHFYDHETKDVKPQFLNHLDKLPSKAHGDKRIPEDTHWISSCVDLIKGIVRKEPKERLEANKIRAKLSKIDLSMRPEKREWLSHDLTLDLANVDTDPAISGQASAVSQSPTEYDDSDYARDEALNRVPSICFHPAEHSMPEITRPRHNGEDERRRATAPR